MNWFMIKPRPPISDKPWGYLAGELHAVDDVPHLVRQSLRVFTGGGVVIESLLHHPVPELLQMAVTPPGVLVQLQTFDVGCCQKYVFLYHQSQTHSFTRNSDEYKYIMEPWLDK